MVKYKITAIAAPAGGDAACTWKNTVRGGGADDTYARQFQHNQEEYKHEARNRSFFPISFMHSNLYEMS